jgi:hypothetical protein
MGSIMAYPYLSSLSRASQAGGLNLGHTEKAFPAIPQNKSEFSDTDLNPRHFLELQNSTC